MRQIIQIFLFDLRMSIKNFMGSYMIIVPFAILLILRLFLPAVDNTTVRIAVVDQGPNKVEDKLIERLEALADISRYESVEELNRKVRGIGDVEGVYWDPDNNQYVSLVDKTGEENQTFSISSRYVRQLYFSQNYPEHLRTTVFSSYIPEELSDRTEISPVASIGGSIFVVFMIIVSAILLGLGIVDDKDQGTILAFRVSPVSSSDYYIGRAIFPLIINLVYAIIALFILGLSEVNISQVMVVVLFGFGTTLIYGLFVGALANNEVEGIGIAKISSMVLLLAILGATLLPDNWQWIVWWSPVYWTYSALEEIFTQTSTWLSVVWKSALSMVISFIYFLLLRKKIFSGLAGKNRE